MNVRTVLRPGRHLAAWVVLTLLLLGRTDVEAGESGSGWIIASGETNRPTWGRRGALLWGLPSGGSPVDGPRGLIRLHYPILKNGGYDLVNFIAIEPVVAGRRGFSELEPSTLDGVGGKRLSAVATTTTGTSGGVNFIGQVERVADGGERLTVEVEVERFANGAHVRLQLTQRSARPDELELTVQPEPDSAAIQECILTATMGNKARARRLWLANGAIGTRELYPDYREPDFAPHRIFGLDRLARIGPGEVWVAVTNDEPDPARVDVAPAAAHWNYRGRPVTQYWRKPAGSWHGDMRVAVNGRYTYWMSRHPIPGGLAFENFELRERFEPGQRAVFGMTFRSPAELGFPANVAR